MIVLSYRYEVYHVCSIQHLIGSVVTTVIVMDSSMNTMNNDVNSFLDINNDSVTYKDLFNWSDDKLDGLLDAIALRPDSISAIAKKSIGDSITQAPSQLTCNNLALIKPVSSTLLNNINFCVDPGTLVCCVGSSDAGISLLFNVIYQPDKYQHSGEILVDNQPIDCRFHQLVGYVLREMFAFPYLTVYEAFYISAKLRVENLPDRIVRFRVKYVLLMLSLQHVQHSIIGSDSVRGVSGGERRRVIYGCELIAGHSIVLADSPTDGLDSHSAYDLISKYKLMSKAGRSMLVKLNQPSVDLFDLFDMVLLMSKGTQIYYGRTNNIIDHLQQQCFIMPSHMNVPEFLQQLSRAPEKYWSTEKSSINSDRTYLSSRSVHNNTDTNTVGEAVKLDIDTIEQRRRAAIDVLAKTVPKVHQLQNNTRSTSDVCTIKHKHHSSYNSSIITQFKQCLIRESKLTYRNTDLWRQNFLRNIIMGFILGSTYYKIGVDEQGVRDRISLFYFLITYTGNTAIQMITVLITYRSTVHNEMRAKYYNGGVYVTALICTFIPIALIESFILALPLYGLANLNGNVGSINFLYFFLMTCLVDLNARSWILMLSSFIPTATLANILSPVFNLIISAYCGFLVIKPDLPSPYRYTLYYLSYYTYALQGMSVNDLQGLDYSTCAVGGIGLSIGNNNAGGISNACITDFADALSVYAIPDIDPWLALFYSVCFYVGFNTITAICYVAFDYSTQGKDSIPDWTSDEQVQATAIETNRQSTLIRARTGSHRYANTMNNDTGFDSSRVLSFYDLSYSIDVKNNQQQLLNNIFGYCRSGQMVALVGTSGAGKSTLLDVLAQRKTTGHTAGQVLLNGQTPTKSYKRITGYVEQFDALPGASTVREAIYMSARLRLPSDKSKAEIEQNVDRALQQLELTSVENELIAGDGTLGLPPDIRKRISIAVEAVALPEVLFLDEPTTGLDADAAFSVAVIMKSLSAELPVICTIHQPSQQIVDLFDTILLLGKGGKQCYYGPVRDLIKYLHKIDDTLKYDETMNTVDVALNTVDKLSASTDCDLTQLYVQSDYCKPVLQFLSKSHQLQAEHQQLLSGYNNAENHPIDQSSYQISTSEYVATWYMQCYELTYRFFISDVRVRRNWISRFTTALVFGFLTGTLFYQLGYATQDNLQRLSLIYFSSRFALFSGNLKMPPVFNLRNLYFRETSSKYYTASAYYVARSIADLPFVVVEMLIYSPLVYFTSNLLYAPAGQGAAQFILFYVIMMLNRISSLSFIEMIGQASATIEGAQAVQATFNMIFMLFSGFFIPSTSIPYYWLWIYYISNFNYPIALLSINQLTRIPGGDYVLNEYSINSTYSHQVLDAIMILALIIVFKLATYLLLRYKSFVKR